MVDLQILHMAAGQMTVSVRTGQVAEPLDVGQKVESVKAEQMTEPLGAGQEIKLL